MQGRSWRLLTGVLGRATRAAGSMARAGGSATAAVALVLITRVQRGDGYC